ncbi:pyruvate kinase [Roseicella aquatilis]|uniref:Pyruvate kinase n=1 Tax=Roseicella aquatilis TaxID=2527868 RepID=A0A4R4D3V4_9PROT|nr:pyruvate kinase [Roseicella aquatilis]TCZ51777.1 pyruvate kinase [Roseicella aquatilis]
MGQGSTPDPASLRADIDTLITTVHQEGHAIASSWAEWLIRPDYIASAENLASYLALRHRDLRPLQRPLMTLGLSSLGRLESRVLPTLHAVRATLTVLAGQSAASWPPAEAFFAGEQRLGQHTRTVLGPASAHRPVRLLVTCPTEAADDPSFMVELANRGVEAVRINCAHDDAAAWSRMVAHIRAAEATTGRSMKILMDLAGPKIRTGEVRSPENQKHVGVDALLAVVAPGKLDHVAAQDTCFAVECTLPEIVGMVEKGHRLFVDDGKIGAFVERVEGWGFLARVTSAAGEGVKLKPEKGLNFPDTALQCAALTEKDREALDFVARHADGIGYSFVQSAGDVAALQDELAVRRPHDWQQLSLILKIETTRAVRALPEIVVRAAGQQPAAIMIARGDLAVEIGFARLAEMQEEILWIGEAAHLPVIWATQVLEHLVKKGTPLRGEMTDAAMAARAECVMLNKGPYLFKAIAELDALLGRMDEHQHKKTPKLRRLTSW